MPTIWEQLIGGGIKGLAEGVGSLAKDVRTAITGASPIDATAAAEIQFKMAALEAAAFKAAADYDTAQMTGQIEINKSEAVQTSVWNRWRPAVGWVCVTGLAYTFLLKPLLPFLFKCGALIAGRDASTVPILPEVPMGDLLILLGGMLGIGTMRSVEKIKGVAS